MGKTKFLFGALGAVALGFTACSSDEPLVNENQTVEKDQTRYLSVALCNPTNYMSRADFENGADGESAIDEMLFVFYDGSGAPTASMQKISNSNGDWTTNTTGNNVTKFWTSVIPVEMTQGQNKPVYVMCFINPIEQENLSTMTLSEIDALERNAVYNNGYFAMSNSVYYGNNPITGQQNVRIMATPITEGQLFESEEQAKAELDKPDTDNSKITTDIYVERYAAKIGVTMQADAVEDGYDVKIAGADGLTDGKIYFTPVYWRPNAVDLTTFVTKGFSVKPEGASVEHAASYAEMRAAFDNTGMAGEGLTGWNDAANHRSYWACSPSYYANDYPTVSDDITDVTLEGNPYPYDVKYFSFDELVNEENDDDQQNPIKWDNTTGFVTTTAGAGYFYSRETTASLTKLTDKDTNNKAVPAAVNIVGRYRLNDNTANPTFYLYGKSEGKDIYYTDANIKAALIQQQNVIFTNAAGTTRATAPDNFIVEHPRKAVRGNEKVAGRLVTIQIDADDIPEGLYFNQNGRFVEVNETNIDAANKLLWASASTAQKFYQGLAYFAVPIRHLGWEEGIGLTLENTNNGRGLSINWPALRRGDLGVVRNHVYNIEITGVTGLGIGLENPDQPMVPPMDPDNYYIAARLNVLAWRVVPTQSVTL